MICWLNCRMTINDVSNLDFSMWLRTIFLDCTSPKSKWIKGLIKLKREFILNDSKETFSRQTVHTMWINRSCGGRVEPDADVTFSCSSSFSTERSHNVIWWSSPEAANTVLSVGCHSTEVMGPLWCLNIATGTPSPNWRRSHTFKIPSSPPESINGSFLTVKKQNLINLIYV